MGTKHGNSIEEQRTVVVYEDCDSRLIDDQVKFVVDGKKDEVVGVITTYILWEIRFHMNGINYPHQFWKKLKLLFDKVNKSHIMQLEKELISLDPHSFDRI
jgi:hypothetical protein